MSEKRILKINTGYDDGTVLKIYTPCPEKNCATLFFGFNFAKC